MANILLISYDNGSHIPFFPINLFYLTGHLHAQGHTVAIWLQDCHHGNEKALLKIIADNPWDVVGLGFVASQALFTPSPAPWILHLSAPTLIFRLKRTD